MAAFDCMILHSISLQLSRRLAIVKAKLGRATLYVL